EQMGLTMFGQMTAGSWIYIGSQGILQGTYETFAACARKHFASAASASEGPLAGRFVLTAGLGGMGGAQPLAATMNGWAFLAIEVNAHRLQRRLETGYIDRITEDLDEALLLVLDAKRDGRPLSVGLLGNAADVMPELVRRGVVPDVVTDQTSAHDPLNGYVPLAQFPGEDIDALRRDDPEQYVQRARESIGKHVTALLDMPRAGAGAF